MSHIYSNEQNKAGQSSATIHIQFYKGRRGFAVKGREVKLQSL